jgi:hypothetical protein
LGILWSNRKKLGCRVVGHSIDQALAGEGLGGQHNAKEYGDELKPFHLAKDQVVASGANFTRAQVIEFPRELSWFAFR